jgi:hypothetical protein
MNRKKEKRGNFVLKVHVTEEKRKKKKRKQEKKKTSIEGERGLIIFCSL